MHFSHSSLQKMGKLNLLFIRKIVLTIRREIRCNAKWPIRWIKISKSIFVNISCTFSIITNKYVYFLKQHTRSAQVLLIAYGRILVIQWYIEESQTIDTIKSVVTCTIQKNELRCSFNVQITFSRIIGIIYISDLIIKFFATFFI